ncbi:nuclear factor of activated T-cells, cytoplasmic 1 [Herpailurus yagouaroundi]|uniref:nuclear factor of activated T-cells, cytoplasmic 1 n=1 Tax=Herpailurus yagouaroundi TaxID=1608482 RepID=UPI001AD7806E|nr:nuclear factor of activated T-cells, cytoplasmic 1 [Puma yagouaroundi]
MPGAAAGQPPGYGGAVDSGPSSYLLSSSHIRPNGAPALESPRIEITSYMGLHHGNNQFFHDVEAGDVIPSSKRPPSTATLNLPNLEAYRDPSCLSPASSLSSRSCNSEASSYESNFSYPYASPQTSPWQSPCVSPKTTDPEEGFPRGLGACGLLGSPRHSPSTSPRTSVTEESWLGARTSRPSSPCNKRKYGLNGRQLSCSPHHSPTPSPRSSPRVSVTDDTWLGNSTQYTSSAIVAAINALSTDSTLELGDGVPVKARKTALDRCPSVALKVPARGGPPLPAHPEGRLLRPVPVGAAAPLPVGQAQVPDILHQLHGYLENEPLTLQLFIGTADDRLLRPHAFYQVHRITGKTVSTTSHEAILSNTKVLEIPLLPENNMRAIVDCAGILKLRNSDIELRKGETDIGRKNTRVRLVFRVHIPQPNGRTLSLQVASNPIECSQRSAQELPLVEKQSAASCPVLGGKKMVLSGHNFLQDSKVIFVEKAPDGHHIWEAEAKTDRGLCKPNSLVVEIPPFRNPRITSPVQVSFYVCNGKRKRSQYQHLTYLPANAPTIKTEPADDHEPALTCGPGGQGLSPLPQPRFSQQLVVPPDPGSCLVAGFPPCPQRSTVVSPPPGTGQELHDLSSAAYGKGTASQGHGHLGLQRPAGGVLAVRETPRPVGVHPGPPQQPPPALLQPQSCSPTRPSEMGRQQHRLPKAPRSESAAPRPPPLPEVREDSSHSLAPFPVTVKREPQELDQLYLDDVNEIIRNDLSSTNI